jgi:7,8-dihydroneopterin aldolase/epimerase/oxygenase
LALTMANSVREDRITLAGIKIRPRIGVTPGERRLPQPCQADIIIFGDFEAAASTDSLDRAINYSQVLSTVLETTNAREYNLLETLAYSLGRAILQSFPARRVVVKVRKRPMTLVEKLDFIEVEVEQPGK